MFELKRTVTISLFIPKNNTGNTHPLKFLRCIGLLTISSLLFFHLSVQAQCANPISNNSFELKPAVCAATVATLQGSIPTGGNGSFTFQWEKAVGNCGMGNFQAIPGATNRDYAVPSSTDPDDCFRRVVVSGQCTSTSGTMKVPLADRTNPSPPTTTVVQPSCSQNAGTITVTNPAPGAGISYSINGSDYSNTTGIFNGLNPGNYSVSVKFPAGCVSPAKVETINSLATVTGTILPASATFCDGDSAVLTISGGTSYQWLKNGTAIPGATFNTYTAKAAGNYTATIMNGGCTGNSTNSSTITVTPLPSGTISPANVTICAGSSTTLTVSGGSSYQWYRNNVSISGATGNTYVVTQQGAYSADIIGSTGCKAKASNQSEVTVAALPSGSISPVLGTLCTNGSVVLTVSGGTSYQWYKNGTAIAGATAATYTVTSAGSYTADILSGNCTNRATNTAVISQGNGVTGTITPSSAIICPGTSQLLTATGGVSYQWYKDGVVLSGITSATYTATQPGTYSVIMNNGSCSGPANNVSTVTQGVSPSGFITPSSASICPGSTVVLTAVAAGGGYTYQWFRNGSFITGANAATYNATQPGSYNVLFFNGSCNGSALNIVAVAESDAINFTANTTNPSCTLTTGSITIGGVTGGGSTNYRYSKDNGVTFQTSNTFNNLPIGTYQVVVKDTAGCISQPKPVTIQSVSSTLSATVNTTDVTCSQSTGAVTVTASGGVMPYQYSLNGSAFQSTNSFNNLAVGNYTLVIKDAAGCNFEKVFTISQVASTLQANAVKTDATCGQSNGAVTIQATGGTPAYTYSLDNGSFQSSNSFNNITVGNHTVTVKDQAGCNFAVAFVIGQNGVNPNLIITHPVICPGSTANLQLPSITAGSDAGLVYTYWADLAATTPLASPGSVTAGTYYIKATNAAGCYTVKPVTIQFQTLSPGSIAIVGPSTVCSGDTITLTASNGTAYQWFRNDTMINGATAVFYKATVNGIYSVLITTGGCSVLASNRINLQFLACSPIPDTKVFVPTGFTPNKNGVNDVLRPLLYNVSELRYFKLFNRWGQQVFQTNVPGQGWDGTIKGVQQPAETYSWILECIGKNGEVVRQSGRTVLIR